MKILLTGSSGFLGSLIQRALLAQDVFTLGRLPTNNLYCDLALEVPQLPNSFDVVVHSAGKAHSIPRTVGEKQAFFAVNVKGTANLLQSLTAQPPRSFVLISSVAVYGLLRGMAIDESAPLLAQDPYGLSKIHAEQLVVDWCAKHDVKCSVLRLPLLVGPNPPGNLGAMIRGIQKGYYLNIAGGKARKSMVLATDVAAIILKVAELGGIYNLTDGKHPSFAELSQAIATHLNRSSPITLPYWPIKVLALLGDVLGTKFPVNSQKLLKLTSDLTFSDSAARLQLNWDPSPVLGLYQNHISDPTLS